MGTVEKHTIVHLCSTHSANCQNYREPARQIRESESENTRWLAPGFLGRFRSDPPYLELIVEDMFLVFLLSIRQILVNFERHVQSISSTMAVMRHRP